MIEMDKNRYLGVKAQTMSKSKHNQCKTSKSDKTSEKPLMKVTTGCLYSLFNTPGKIDNWKDPSSQIGIETKKKLEVLRMEEWKSINLTVEKHRTMIAVNNLWYKKDKRDWVIIKLSEYYEAFGLKYRAEKDGKKRYGGGRERKKAFNSLFDLAKQHHTVIYGIPGEKGYIPDITEDPYYRVVLIGPKISQDQLRTLPYEIQKTVKELKNPLLAIKLHPTLQENALQYKYFLADYYERLKRAKNGRLSKYEMYFLDWLTLQNQVKISIWKSNRRKFAVDVLKMSEKRIKKNRKYMRNTILKLYETFKKAGFLIDYRLDDRHPTTGRIRDTLYLNPEQFPSLRLKELPLKDVKGGYH